MATYRGITIADDFLKLAKNLESVNNLIDELRELQNNWNSLSLLSELSQVSTEIARTRESFQRLASELSNCLIEKSVEQANDLLGNRAQNAIDILVRNLFERTADIGFLATDPILVHACTNGFDDWEKIRIRMQQYVQKYSVYSNVTLLDTQGRVLTDMAGKHPQGLPLEWIKQGVDSCQNYFEQLWPTGNQHTAPSVLLYAWKIASKGLVVGYVALEFDLESEQQALFTKVLGAQSNQEDDWSVCGILDEKGRVLISSDAYSLPSGLPLSLPHTGHWTLCRIGPTAYLACARDTRGYQGYMGPGWTGFCLVPLAHAFTEVKRQLAGTDDHEINFRQDLIDQKILELNTQALQIQQQLNRNIWNGNISQTHSKDAMGGQFSKTLLWEISRTGDRTKALFNSTLKDLISGSLQGTTQSMENYAMLAVELMDRNLYERANDCRWWALNPTLQECLASATQDVQPGVGSATECLQIINSLYTVYTDILLIDTKGQIMCNSATPSLAGQHVQAEWVQRALALKDQNTYCVSRFEPTDLYQGRPTYIYCAPVFAPDLANGNAIGLVALVFDSEVQFGNILREAMGDAAGHSKGYFVDEQGLILASSHNDQPAGTRLPVLNNVAFKGFQKGQASKITATHADQLLAIGTCDSSNYREYKGDLDGYQNQVRCIYLAEMGTHMQRPKALEPLQFYQTEPRSERTLSLEVATFSCAGQWIGLPTDQVVDSFSVAQLARMPNAASFVLGSALQKNQVITVIDTAALLGQRDAGSPCDHGHGPVQVIRLKSAKGGVQVALAVDELGQIPNLPEYAFKPAKDLHAGQGLIETLVEASNGFLCVLDFDALHRALHMQSKTSPQVAQQQAPQNTKSPQVSLEAFAQPSAKSNRSALTDRLDVAMR